MAYILFQLLRLLGSVFSVKMSAGMRTVEYTRTFTEDEWSMLEVGTVAMSMEEKWDVVRHDHDHHHFFARNWSQRIVFILPLDQSGSRTCTQLFVHNDVSDEIALNVNPPVDVAYWFDIVVDHVLFHRPCRSRSSSAPDAL